MNIFEDGPYEVGGETDHDESLVPVPANSYLGRNQRRRHAYLCRGLWETLPSRDLGLLGREQVRWSQGPAAALAGIWFRPWWFCGLRSLPSGRGSLEWGLNLLPPKIVCPLHGSLFPEPVLASATWERLFGQLRINAWMSMSWAASPLFSASFRSYS